MRRLLLSLGTILLISCGLPTSTAQSCENAQLSGQGAWPKNAAVTVNLDPSFTTEEKDAIRSAFAAWQNAGSASGNSSGVTFEFISQASAVAGTGGSTLLRMSFR